MATTGLRSVALLRFGGEALYLQRIHASAAPAEVPDLPTTEDQ